MGKLTQNQIKEVKQKGFLINRGTQEFSGRIVPRGCVFTAEDLKNVANIAEKFGNGKVVFTTRLTAEIVGIPYEKIEPAIVFANECKLHFGGTGAKIRPITACKGTTCIYGNFDTQELAAKIYDRYYVGMQDIKLPHKFKIGIGGCPNSCMKPSLNDFGIEGHRPPDYQKEECKGCKVCNIEKHCPSKAAKIVDGKMEIDEKACTSCGVCSGKCSFKAVKEHFHVLYQIYVGGTWGKKSRIGTPLSHLVEQEEIFPLLEKIMIWYKLNGESKERLGNVIDRIGSDVMEQALFSQDLLEQKDCLYN